MNLRVTVFKQGSWVVRCASGRIVRFHDWADAITFAYRSAHKA